MEPSRILILDDEHSRLISHYLSKMGFLTYQAERPSKAFTILEREKVNLALVDINLPEMSGVDVIRKIQSEHPGIITVAVTGSTEISMVINCFRAGARDFLPKPFNYDSLKEVIERTNSFQKLQGKLQNQPVNYRHIQSPLNQKFPVELIGVSSGIKKVIHLAARVADTHDTSVLITGESGTGKELVAHSIHALSHRAERFFHCVNCSAIPETLFESEFFGYKKGSFTGAIANTSGWFEAADKGTLFLDEIAELPMHMQAKFLRVLDDKMISKIGTTDETQLDVRIIAATNQNLEELVRKKAFREDLYHRLNSFHIHIPPLRERKEDILELINFFIRHFSKYFGKTISHVDEKVYHTLYGYDFPGNVRELKNMIERALILCDQSTLYADDFFVPTQAEKAMSSAHRSHDSLSEVLDLDRLEEQAILKALQKSRYNRSKAALLLNISRQTLNRKIQKYQLLPEQRKSSST